MGIAAALTKLPRSVVRDLDLLTDVGVEVQQVAPKSLADQAGIRADDVIIELAGRLITSVDDLHRLLMTLPIDQGFELTVIRGERRQPVYVAAKG